MVNLIIKHKSGREIRIDATIRTIAERLFKVMTNHIGIDDYISRDALFKKVYMVGMNDLPDLQTYVLQDLLRRAVHYCRTKTNCFIINTRVKANYYYFVVKNKHEAQVYSTMINKRIKNLKAIEKKCFKAVEQKWYKREWAI